MADQACIAFLKWCLPELGLRWPGYRKVRRLVGKRLTRRLAELGLPDLDAYRALLLREPDEWARLDAMYRIPISRLYRDRDVRNLQLRPMPPPIHFVLFNSGYSGRRLISFDLHRVLPSIE